MEAPEGCFKSLDDFRAFIDNSAKAEETVHFWGVCEGAIFHRIVNNNSSWDNYTVYYSDPDDSARFGPIHFDSNRFAPGDAIERNCIYFFENYWNAYAFALRQKQEFRDEPNT